MRDIAETKQKEKEKVSGKKLQKRSMQGEKYSQI